MTKAWMFPLLLITLSTFAQKKAHIEPCACPFPLDSSVKTRCAYLLVPENRKKPNSKTIKLPFIIAYSNNPNKHKDPLLYTAGGPGGSSLGWIRGAMKHDIIKDRDCIAFEQRGTRWAQPDLWTDDIVKAIKEAYRKNLPKDSMIMVGVKRCKATLEAKGIDLEGYNTDETVADIHALIKALSIDSINLLGGSYSGGLMLAVLQKDPSHIRSLVLDSPLPTFVPIDEDEPANFNEALNIIFRRCEKDSVDKQLYGNLKQRFEAYFTAIGGKTFYLPCVDKDTKDTLQVAYNRNELLNVLVNTVSDYTRIKEVPYIITEMISGRHEAYIKPVLEEMINTGGGFASGMRLSVYCADQTAYHDEAILKQVYNVYPYMEGYHINDVHRELCDCWKVPPISPKTKQPFYSPKPVLLADGELDPACRPSYIDRIHHYMPNSQRLLFPNRSHMVLGGKEMDTMVRAFLEHPYQPVVPQQTDVIIY